MVKSMIAPAARHAIIRTGVAGWNYPDWNGVFYPEPRPRAFHELSYLAQFFNTIEINSSFYRPPQAEWVKKWIEQVERRPDFVFTAKLWRGFTHERNATPEDAKTFAAGLQPLALANRLGALLLQFPWSFKNTAENRVYLAQLLDRFGGYPRVVEVRHSTWNQQEFLDWLGERGVGICNIDQPVIGKSLEPSSYASGSVGYVRFHGRNAAQWFAKNEGAAERYDYLYTRAELEPWAERIGQIAQNGGTVFVIANNHPNAKAVVNALQLENLLSSRRVKVPETLLRNYAQLREISLTETAPIPTQRDLDFSDSA